MNPFTEHIDISPGALITISGKEYKQLKDDQNTLRALEAGGVDNWEGYDQCLEHELKHLNR